MIFTCIDINVTRKYQSSFNPSLGDAFRVRLGFVHQFEIFGKLQIDFGLFDRY